jgi:hypothetical protein
VWYVLNDANQYRLSLEHIYDARCYYISNLEACLFGLFWSIERVIHILNRTLTPILAYSQQGVSYPL